MVAGIIGAGLLGWSHTLRLIEYLAQIDFVVGNREQAVTITNFYRSPIGFDVMSLIGICVLVVVLLWGHRFKHDDNSHPLVIHSAVYGTGPDTDVDVTEALKRNIGNGLAVMVTNELAGRDPLFGIEKRIQVEYSYGNPHRFRVVRPERSRLVLPEDTWMRDKGERSKTAEGAAQPSPQINSAVPDVALLWDWTEDKKKVKSLMGFTEKDILIHNRSQKWIYNVTIEPIVLDQTLEFDKINEVGPDKQHLVLARWDGRTSATTNYIYFFGNEKNELAAVAKGWLFKKKHNRGISDTFLRVPFTLSFDCDGRRYQQPFDFYYDPGDESMFGKTTQQQ